MSRVAVHAISGSMIVKDGVVDKLLKICKGGIKSGLIFVIAPVCNTDLELTQLLEAARGRDERLWAMMEGKTHSWSTLIEALVPSKNRNNVEKEVKEGFAQVEAIVRAAWLVNDITQGSQKFIDSIVSGWATSLLKESFKGHGYWCESGDINTFLDSKKGEVAPNTILLLTGELPQSDNSPLDRDSEYAASLVASKVEASSITFWNEDRLVTTADVADVPSATVIPAITFAEATELSFFGSRVIRQQHMVPVLAQKIPLYLRSFAQIEHPGTFVDDGEGAKSFLPVKGFSVVREIALINVEGAGMIGVPGIAQRLFGAMQEAGISVILISQASSEYSICFAVPAEQSALATAVAKSTFASEISAHQIHSVEAELGLAILAAVGKNMSGVPGISGTVFGALGRARVNVRAIAQGSSERNISVVIKEEDTRRALRTLHAAFFLSKQTISVGLFGPGNIGGTLLDQISEEAQRLNEEFGVDIRIRAIANQFGMILDDQGVDLKNWRDRFEKEAVELSVEKMVKHVGASYFPHAVLIDCTGSGDLPPHYVEWMERGIHIITPNKRAGTSPYDYYSRLMEVGRRNGKHFLYETTVGAGLPIIGTLKDLIQTGDRVISIEGIVSGTLAYLFSSYDGTTPFSDLVKGALEMGYTEPDPRDDLSGMDVARKTIILARELGYKVEIEDIDIVSLVPKELENVPLQEFLERLELIDKPIEELYQKAFSEGKRLRYVGRVTKEGQCVVELAPYDVNHPFAQSKGTDNVVAFTTKRYLTQPLVIQGPGAGPEVTAGGVFADLLRLSAYLGARL